MSNGPKKLRRRSFPSAPGSSTYATYNSHRSPSIATTKTGISSPYDSICGFLNSAATHARQLNHRILIDMPPLDFYVDEQGGKVREISRLVDARLSVSCELAPL